MGIHQPPKTHPQRTVQSTVTSPYLFPTWKVTVAIAYCLFLESFAHGVPLNASLRIGFLQNENMIPKLNYQYCMKGVLCRNFLQHSLMWLKVWMSDIGPRKQWLNEDVHKWFLLGSLVYCGKCVFQQSTASKFRPSSPTRSSFGWP